MITAREALDLHSPSDDDIEMARDVIKKIDKHIRAKMTFAGPEPLEIRPDELNYSSAKIVAVALKKLGWNVSASLGVKQSNLGGRTPMWQIQFSPTIEVYEEALTEFDIEAPPQLVA